MTFTQLMVDLQLELDSDCTTGSVGKEVKFSSKE